MTGTAPHALRVDLHATYAVSGLADEWNDLHARLGALPFASFAWNASWWDSMRRQSGWTHDSLRLCTVRDERGRLIAVSPMMLTERKAVGMPFARTLQFLGADPNITEVRGPLVSIDDEHRVVEALVAELLRSDDFDRLIWSGLRTGGAAAASLLSTNGATEVFTTPMYVVDLPDSWEALKTGLPRNTREALRKCYNSLARGGHAYELRSLESPEDIDASLGLFFRLHGMRAELTNTVQHRNCFASPHAQRFLRETMAQFARSGRARMFQLEVDGKVVAMRLGLLYADGIYLYYSGYDPAWGKYSVMTTLVAEALKYSIAARLRFANLSTGTDRSKLRWRPDETWFDTVLLTRDTSRARLAARVEAMGSRIRGVKDRVARLR